MTNEEIDILVEATRGAIMWRGKRRRALSSEEERQLMRYRDALRERYAAPAPQQAQVVEEPHPEPVQANREAVEQHDPQPAPRRRGRPPGSKNRPKFVAPSSFQPSRRGRPKGSKNRPKSDVPFNPLAAG
jgi:hypothetical protein